MTLGLCMRISTSHRTFSAASISVIIAGATFLLLPALVNGFPFVFPDTIDYLIFTPRLYRSPFYGLFIFFFHLNRFIWAPVLVQALIASHLIWVLVRIYAGATSIRWFSLAILVLGLLSSLPFFVDFIMPDFFTAVMILLFYVLGFHWSALNRGERLYFLLLACVAISAHISHLPQALALAILVVALHLGLVRAPRSSLKQGAILVVPLGLATCATLLNNVLIHHVFGLFPAGQTFVLANMIDQGPARQYLHEVCPAAGFKVCGILDSLPARSYEFLWTSDVLERLGGFSGMREEAKEIVTATIRTHPGDVFRMALRNIGSTFFVHAPGAELTPLPPLNDFWMKEVLEKKFGHERARDYQMSLQSRGEVPRPFLRALDELILPAAVVTLIFAGVSAARRGLLEGVSLVLFVSCALLINNVICALGSGVNDRYQARVTWLVALSALLIFARLVRTTEALEGPSATRTTELRRPPAQAPLWRGVSVASPPSSE